MAKMNWPPEKTFKYKFNDELEMDIPLEENTEKDMNIINKLKKENKDREI